MPGRRNLLLTARKVSVILLASLGLFVLVSGILLETAPKGPGSGKAVALGLSKELWTDIHVYAGFALAGAAVIHIYTNYRGLFYHLGLLRLRAARGKTRQPRNGGRKN